MSGFCCTETGCLFLFLHHMHVLDARDLYGSGRAESENDCGEAQQGQMSFHCTFKVGGVSWHNFLRPTVVNKAGGAADQSGPFSNFSSVENGTYFAFCTVREEDKLLSYLQYHLASGDASVLTELHFFFSLIGAYPACEQSIAFIGV